MRRAILSSAVLVILTSPSWLQDEAVKRRASQLRDHVVSGARALLSEQGSPAELVTLTAQLPARSPGAPAIRGEITHDLEQIISLRTQTLRLLNRDGLKPLRASVSRRFSMAQADGDLNAAREIVASLSRLDSLLVDLKTDSEPTETRISLWAYQEKEPGYETVTNAVIANVWLGEYVLRAEKEGHKTAEKSLDLATNADPVFCRLVKVEDEQGRSYCRQ